MKTSIVESQVRALQYPQCGDSLAVKYDDFIKHHIFGTFEPSGRMLTLTPPRMVHADADAQV